MRRSWHRVGLLSVALGWLGMGSLGVRPAHADGAAVSAEPVASASSARPGARLAVPPPPPPPALGSAPAVHGSAPSGPRSAELAASLARRLGLTYEDSGAFVLLSDGLCRVRLFPNSHVVSLDGTEVTLRGLLSRELGGVMVPGPAAGIIEQHVTAARAQRGARPVEVAPPAPPALVKPLPKQPVAAPVALAPAPAAGASVVMPDPQWVVAPTARAWRWIVLHHSDDTSGCVAKYHQVHLDKGWENGCGYHFVIGNGTQSGDGQVEVSSRWRLQQQGAHAKTPDNLFNDYGIGICLVGDFEHGGRPTAAQMRGLVRLVQWLMDRYDIPSASVRGHCDCKPTCCPGKNFPWAELRARLREPSRSLAAASAAARAPVRATQPVAALPLAPRVGPTSAAPSAFPQAAMPPAAAPPAVVRPRAAPSTLGLPPAGPWNDAVPAPR